jgi:UDP-N-acetylglucosamine 2-epimerase
MYFSLMAQSAAMVGNSSSGIIEAASFGLPVVNIGSRQRGRLRAGNVIDVGNEQEAIAEGIRRALDPAFRERLRDMPNPYGSGNAARDIVRVLQTMPLDGRLIQKHFFDAVDARFPDAAAIGPAQDVSQIRCE